MSTNPTRMCEILVGLPAVNILEVEERHDHVRVVLENKTPAGLCRICGSSSRVKDRPVAWDRHGSMRIPR